MWLFSFSVWFLLFHAALVLAAGSRIIYSRRSADAALGWLVFVFAVPYLGVLLYVLIGEPRLGNRRAKRMDEIVQFYDRFSDRMAMPAFEDTPLPGVPEAFQRLAQIGKIRTGLNVTLNNRTEVIDEPEEILRRFAEDIARAKHTVLMMFYIVEAEGGVIKVLEALEAAAKRGVRCQLLVDDVGSGAFVKSDWPKRLQDAGVWYEVALEVGVIKTLFVRADLRNHRKILVVDYETAYTGSFNLIDPKLFKKDAVDAVWVDAMMRCQGPVAKLLAGVFYADWALEIEEHFDEAIEKIRDYVEEHPAGFTGEPGRGDAALQVIPSAPDQKYYVMYETLVCAIHAAQSAITIATPYFVPDETLLLALTTAAKRGVKIVLIIPEKTDAWIVTKASKAYYQALLDVGIEIAVYQGGLLHTKAVSIDGVYALFGTVNMDMRSFYLNMEVTLAVYNLPTVAQIDAMLARYYAACRPVTLKRWQKRPKLARFVERCVRLVSPLL